MWGPALYPGIRGPPKGAAQLPPIRTRSRYLRGSGRGARPAAAGNISMTRSWPASCPRRRPSTLPHTRLPLFGSAPHHQGSSPTPPRLCLEPPRLRPHEAQAKPRAAIGSAPTLPRFCLRPPRLRPHAARALPRAAPGSSPLHNPSPASGHRFNYNFIESKVGGGSSCEERGFHGNGTAGPEARYSVC